MASPSPTSRAGALPLDGLLDSFQAEPVPQARSAPHQPQRMQRIPKRPATARSRRISPRRLLIAAAVCTCAAATLLNVRQDQSPLTADETPTAGLPVLAQSVWQRTTAAGASGPVRERPKPRASRAHARVRNKPASSRPTLARAATVRRAPARRIAAAPTYHPAQRTERPQPAPAPRPQPAPAPAAEPPLSLDSCDPANETC